ncbi:uncharacterized protein LOC108336776 [Vigna angularis]|uniref:uncharacterized protein LOC108336776 n=1 Tax=Phaseolus angularis TaxID=3914 RepID=UPI000809D5C2|nr:uncharacterized protein LOC108336776 [Vigna angularis]
MDAWEDLVYDDDVLKSFLKKCDASASLIPGPAGNVQAAFLNRTKTEQPKSTQEFARDVAQATYERDFNSNAWKWAQMYIEHHVLVTDGKFENVNSLDEAKSAQVLPFVACILKECKPNGLGDMQFTIKDPTTTMKASLHKKVLQDPQFGDNIGVGSVMLLNLVFLADICTPTIELVKDTPKLVIRLPMWAKNNKNVDDILCKFVPPSDEPSTSKEPNKH